MISSRPGYSPKLARFMSKDPIGFKGSKWNLFAYVRNVPTRFIDASGTSSELLEISDLWHEYPTDRGNNRWPVAIVARLTGSDNCSGKIVNGRINCSGIMNFTLSFEAKLRRGGNPKQMEDGTGYYVYLDENYVKLRDRIIGPLDVPTTDEAGNATSLSNSVSLGSIPCSGGSKRGSVNLLNSSGGGLRIHYLIRVRCCGKIDLGMNGVILHFQPFGDTGETHELLHHKK